MLVFGHAGITLGAAALLAGTLGSSRLYKTAIHEVTGSGSTVFKYVHTTSHFPSNKTSWINTLGSYIDIRLLLIGSLLPDIIDVPTGLLFFKETFGSGRIFCHTLLFFVFITVSGFYLYRVHGKTWLIAVSFGTLTHLLLDQMWHTPQTLLWPLHGLNFQGADISGGIEDHVHSLLIEPAYYIPELIGAAIVSWFTWVLLRSRKISVFVKSGRIE